MIDPQQALFGAVREKLKEIYPDSVYDEELPPEGTPYPFTYLGDFDQYDIENKSIIMGRIAVTIHNWHSRADKRGIVSARNLAVKNILRDVTHKDYAFHARNVVSRITTDNTTSTPLVHGIVEAEIYFSPKH